MKSHLFLFCAIVYVISAADEHPLTTFNLPYVDGTTRQLMYKKKDYSECLYTDRTKTLICNENQLYNSIVNVWTKLPSNIRYVSVNCLRDPGNGKGSGLCICKNRATGSLVSEPYTYCHLTSVSMGSFNGSSSVDALDLSESQLSTIGPRSFSGLESVKYISLAQNPIFNVPFGIFCDTPNLEYLDMSYLALDHVFPSQSFICKNPLDKLEAINFRNSGIKDVPNESMKYLSSLTSLDLSANKLVEIYKLSFSGGISLRHLNLSDNSLTYLFPYFCDYLPKMTSLHLRNNNFKYFQFEEINNCTNLELLDLSSNRIRYFTGSSSTLVSLKTFDMSNNSVNDLNFTLAMSENLTWLDTSMNDIYRIQDGFLASHLKLEYFNMSHNSLSISDNFEQIFTGLKSLASLDLSHNNLANIQANGFKGLANLTHLYLHHNRLDSLDGSSFSGLVSLKQLSLSHNKLMALPKSIFTEMTSLLDLTLSFNALVSIEANFWPPLVSLSLDHNLIARVVPGDFSKLENVDLSHNRLRTFVGSDDSTFVNFENVIDLDLSFNAINDISPRLFQSCKNLESLNLEHNQLNFNISFEFLSNAKNLTTLNLAYNKFEEIGLIFTNDTLTQVKTLNISNNQIKTLHTLTDGLTECNIEVIDLSNSGITKLQQNIFTGLPELHLVDLSNNSIETFPILVASDHTLFDFTDNPIICACNMSWLLEPWIEVASPKRIRIATHNFHIPFCKVYTELEVSNPVDLSRRQFMCPESDDCDHRCSCYTTDEDGPVKTVICHNGLSSVPAVISSTALSIFLDGNSFLSNSSLNSFLTYDNMSATELYLNHSGIRTLDSRTFHEFGVLLTFSLAHNNLAALPSDIFQNKSMLKELYLNDNKIRAFENGVFENLPSLKELDISGNNLIVLSAVTTTELSALEKAMYFFLARNPWSCSCTNVGFKEFIDNVKFRIRDRRSLYCAGTKEEMLYLSKSSFSCLSVTEKKGNPLYIIGIMVAILLLILVLAVLVYFRREVLSILHYYTGCRIPGRERLAGMHFDCYLNYDPVDNHCSDYVQKTLSPKLRDNGYSIQSSNDIIQDFEVTRKVIGDSRCALFIVDKNFATNPFYVKVFQMSLDRRRVENGFRVILLILGDIDLLALQADLLKLLRKGDYITARSRVWWQRLLYELPKPSGNHGFDVDSASESDVIVFSSLNDDADV